MQSMFCCFGCCGQSGWSCSITIKSYLFILRFLALHLLHTGFLLLPFHSFNGVMQVLTFWLSINYHNAVGTASNRTKRRLVVHGVLLCNDVPSHLLREELLQSALPHTLPTLFRHMRISLIFLLEIPLKSDDFQFSFPYRNPHFPKFKLI